MNWFGDWSNSALYQVAHEFTIKVDLERADWTKPDFFPVAVQGMFFFKYYTFPISISVCFDKGVSDLKAHLDYSWWFSVGICKFKPG